MTVTLCETRRERARAIAKAGGIDAALASGALPQFLDLSLSEALVLGLMRQGVRKYLGVFGHGTTDVGEVLVSYEGEGLVEVYNLRSELEASARRRGSQEELWRDCRDLHVHRPRRP